MFKNFILCTLCGVLLSCTPVSAQDKLQALIQKLQTGTDAEKLAAATALTDIASPEAATAVPGLVAALQAKSEDLRLNAAIALGKIGAPAVEPVAKLLTSTSAAERYYAIWTLGWIGPDAKSTAPQVIQALADKDENVRRKAAYALGRIAPDAGTAIAPLIKTLADASNEVRQSAAEALAKFGTAAVPPLIDALKDDSVILRTEAARALGNIGSPAKDAVPHLKSVFLGSDAKAASEAAEALAKIGKASLPVLTDTLKHDSPAIRARTIQTLGKIGADAVPVLVDALGDKNVDVRQKAASALAPLRISDKMVVLALAHAVHDADQGVRQQCLQALQMLGSGAKLAAPKLIAALKDSDGQNRLQILNVLQGLGETEQVVPVAADLLKDNNVQVRHAAINLLSTQGKAAIPHLITALQDTELNVRFTAVNALQRVPGDIKEALPGLLPLLKQGNNFQRRSVIFALGRVGEPAVPHLTTALKDPDNFVRAGAADALRSAGADAKKAVPALIDMALQDTYLPARRNAVNAIATIDPDQIAELFAKVKKHPNEQVRQSAYQTLFFRFGGKKGGGSSTLPTKLTIPPLIDATKDGSANIRLLAVQGLGVVGAGSNEAMAAVMALLNDPDQRVRTQAQTTLNQIKGKS